MKSEKDPVIEILIEIVDAGIVAIPITLLVNGFLISGKLISRKSYLESNKSISVINDKYVELLKKLSGISTLDDAKNDFFECVHVNNVRIYGSNLNLNLPITTSLRIPVTCINGYFLGESEV